MLPIHFLVLCGLATLLTTGCGASKPRPEPAGSPQLASAELPPSLSDLGLNDPVLRDDVDAYVTPPLGWKPEPHKASGEHRHQVWLSPSERTAYGVIRFSMPLPLGVETALWGFMREMKRTEGSARLLSKERDEDFQGLRFVAEGGLYTVRANILTRGTRGWAVYAGTRRGQEIQPDELELAERAREHTRIVR